jgi:hypothetical protein
VLKEENRFVRQKLIMSHENDNMAADIQSTISTKLNNQASAHDVPCEGTATPTRMYSIPMLLHTLPQCVAHTAKDPKNSKCFPLCIT